MEPPWPDEDVPVPRLNTPLSPELLTPVPINTEPVVPELAVPVLNIKLPLTPEVPALDVDKITTPLDVTDE